MPSSDFYMPFREVRGVEHRDFLEDPLSQEDHKWPVSSDAVKQAQLAIVAQDILHILTFTDPEIDQYFNLPPISQADRTGKETDVPASYVRARCADKFGKTWMNRTEATHNILVTCATSNETLLYPVHEMTLLSQCGSWQTVLMSEQRRIPGCLPTLSLTIPLSSEFDALMYFLHFHDESKLYESLVASWDDGSLEGQHRLRGFALNVRHMGILDARIRGVLWAVLEPEN